MSLSTLSHVVSWFLPKEFIQLISRGFFFKKVMSWQSSSIVSPCSYQILLPKTKENETSKEWNKREVFGYQAWLQQIVD